MTENRNQQRSVHLAVYDGLADWEVGHLTAHITNGEWQKAPRSCRVVTVGETGDTVTTMGGLRLLPDLRLADLRPEDSEMLVLPGADTWLAGGNTAFVEATGRFLAAGVPVAAICGATAGLAAGGLLDERRHTSDASEFLAATGYAGAAHYVDALATTDGDVITASGVAPVEFAREALARLGLHEPSVLASWYKLYGEHDPAGYHELVASSAA